MSRTHGPVIQRIMDNLEDELGLLIMSAFEQGYKQAQADNGKQAWHVAELRDIQGDGRAYASAVLVGAQPRLVRRKGRGEA